MRKSIFAAVIAIIAVACSERIVAPAAQHETAAREKYPDITLAELTKGHELYVIRCGRCHRAHNPAEYSDQKWEKVLPVMGRKAKLNEAEYNLVSRYVYGMREAAKKR